MIGGIRWFGRSVGWSVAGYTGTFARTLFYVRWCGRVVDRGIGGDDLFFLIVAELGRVTWRE